MTSCNALVIAAGLQTAAALPGVQSAASCCSDTPPFLGHPGLVGPSHLRRRHKASRPYLTRGPHRATRFTLHMAGIRLCHSSRRMACKFQGYLMLAGLVTSRSYCGYISSSLHKALREPITSRGDTGGYVWGVVSATTRWCPGATIPKPPFL